MQFFKKHVQRIRQKPLYVRERILLVLMAVITPALFTLWFATFNFSSGANTASVIKSVTGTITSVSSDPEFSKTFVRPTLSSESAGGTSAGNTDNTALSGSDNTDTSDTPTAPSTYNSSFDSALDDTSAQ